jgi:hypothetical protein
VEPSDTSADAAARMDAALRRMSPVDRVARAVALTRLVHAVALAQIRQSHPGEDERTHRLRLAARIVPAELMKRAFGWPASGVDG